MSINNNINEIAILSIEIGNNQTKFLKIYNNSIPSKLAYNFCLEHNLDYESLKRLTYEIKKLITESNKTTQLNKSFEKSNKLDNVIQVRKNKSMNISPIKVIKIQNKIKTYNFRDIAKEIKKPLEYEFIIKSDDKDKKIYNEKTEEKIRNDNMSNNNKRLNENKKEIASRYLSQTESSKSKIKNKKLKGNKSFESDGKINIYNNIKILNIINNGNLKDDKENKKIQSERNKNIINYGEKLYEKCIKMKKISNEKIKNEIDLEQKKELSECTFKPKINEINIKCFKNTDIKNNKIFNKKEKVKDVQNIIENQNQKIKNEIVKDKEIKNNNISNKKDKKRKNIVRNQTPIYERLYNYHSRKKEEEKNSKEMEILFKPQINYNYKKDFNKKPFNERQKIYSAKSTERRKNLENQIYTKYDSKTGQKLFHPSINKNKHFYKIQNNKYYSRSMNKQKIKDKNGNMKKEILTKIKMQTSFKANIKSDNIYENIIINSFKKIFKILDVNLKGKIYLFNYNTKNLPINIKNIIAPILNQIDLKNKDFNEIKFINECKKLFKSLDYYSKREIYKFSEEEKEIKEHFDLYTLTTLKSKNETDNNIFKSYSRLSTNENNKENIDNNKKLISNDNKKLDINDYYINSKNSKIYERYYNNKTFFREKTTKYYENLIIQRDDIILKY